MRKSLALGLIVAWAVLRGLLEIVLFLEWIKEKRKR